MSTSVPATAAAAAIVQEEGQAPTQTGRAFTARDLGRLDRVSAPRVSPDGRHVVYTVRTSERDGRPEGSVLEILDLSNSQAKPRVLIGADMGGSDASWSADGTSIFFLSAKSGTQQVWTVRPDGSQQRQLTALPVAVGGFRILPAGALLVAIKAHPECDTLVCSKDRDDDLARRVGRGTLIKTGPPRYRSSYEDGRTVGVFRVDLPATGSAIDGRRVIRDFNADVSLENGDMFATQDGSTLYFASLDPAVPKGGENARKLYTTPADGSSTPKPVLGGLGNSISSLAPSPNGQSLAYLATDGSIWAFGRTTVMLRDQKSGRTREVTPGQDILFVQLAWSADGRKLLATADERGQSPLYEIDPPSGKLTKLETEGHVSDVDAAPGAIIFLQDSFQSPPQVFARIGKETRQLTHAGAEVTSQIAMSAAEQFSFAGWNGEPVFGYVVKPHGYIEGHRYPVAFLIHGGPQQNFSNMWSYRWNPQVWAGMGYAVVMIDFHGSTGYGTAFGRSAIAHWDDRPLEDLQKGWAFAQTKFSFLDGDRACAIGGSYGGYMVNWMASQWNAPWKCLVSHAGIFDARSFRLTVGISAFVDAQLDKPTLAQLDRISPGLQFDRWKVPLLVTHGVNDFIVPIDQGVSTYNAARQKGVPTQMLVFQDEGHQLLKWQNVVQWYATIEDWMARWLPAR